MALQIFAAGQKLSPGWGGYGSSCPSEQADFLSVINGDHMSRTDSCSGLEVLSATSCSEHAGNNK